MSEQNYESMGLFWFVEVMDFGVQYPPTDVTNNTIRIIGNNFTMGVDEYATYINKAKECLNQYLKNHAKEAISLWEDALMRPTAVLEFFCILDFDKTMLEDAKGGYFKVVSANFGEKSW